jgi:hypothetical protein
MAEFYVPKGIAAMKGSRVILSTSPRFHSARTLTSELDFIVPDMGGLPASRKNLTSCCFKAKSPRFTVRKAVDELYSPPSFVEEILKK